MDATAAWTYDVLCVPMNVLPDNIPVLEDERFFEFACSRSYEKLQSRHQPKSCDKQSQKTGRTSNCSRGEGIAVWVSTSSGLTGSTV